MHADSTVIISALIETQQHHSACLAILTKRRVTIYSHAIAETFSTLTSGRLPERIRPGQATELLESLKASVGGIVSLSPNEMLLGLRETEARGIRGGAIYDYYHLMAARKVKADRLFTLNLRHFQALLREGDPEIMHPSEF